MQTIPQKTGTTSTINNMKSIILVVDAGSSSIRCNAHEYRGVVKSQNTRISPPLDIIYKNDNVVDVDVAPGGGDGRTTTTTPHPQLVEALRGIGHSVPLTAVIPSTGHIRVYDVLDAIDTCVDETLRSLRRIVHPDPSSGGGEYYRVVAVGFSTFVMNLVAVDIDGDPVGEVATCSYACNRADVVEECEKLIA